MSLLVCENIVKEFGSEENRIAVLKGVSLSLEKGEAATILGSSGAGKSTLLNIIGALDPPSSGKVYLDGEDIYALNDRKISALRNRKLGFVFQLYHLMAELTALENVLLPARIMGHEDAKARARARDLLCAVGLKDREKHFPAQLSGGEQQRAAIARSLINVPELLLADEPTGNLDRKNSENITELLVNLQKEMGFAMLFVTHNRELSSLGRTLVLQDGTLSEAGGKENLTTPKI
ncbi:ABC transporter ATP-binding protein [bacterium]|jgi:lipoprotein-releasing system ATP-binding protein|nr:ABC transporter ATP-binding protein [bacterium]